MADHSERARELFEAAMELSPSGRATFLERECRGQPELRETVEQMLAATAMASDFAGPSNSADAGITIGPYKLLQKIGEGGFGEVWMAEQREPMVRRVALKIIKLGMDTRQVVARFEAERQALALMDHPHIAKVLDGGATENGRPYFVMELVKGDPITKYCDTNDVNTEERLRLFTQVCAAVQHAHQKGIIHRDIKPSNILVSVQDGTPVPKVIDFGIAKATQQQLTDKTLVTQFQQFIGTPAYMSPEQAEMTGTDIDTRTDIYSLGVLLYELLTGTTPFDTKQLLSAGVDEMRRIIRQTDPPRPSTRLRQTSVSVSSKLTTLPSSLATDLDWIVMKCLEKDRTRRYETANALALDLQRHLNNEAVIARPPSNLYRFQKLVRRNRLAFASAAAVLGALILGLGISIWGLVKEYHARQQAKASELLATQNRIRAEQISTSLRNNLYVADMKIASQNLEEGNFGRTIELLEKYIPQAGQEDLRAFEWRYLWNASRDNSIFTSHRHSDRVLGLSIAPGPKLFASGSKDHTIKIWNLETTELINSIPTPGWVFYVALSPDGHFVASICNREPIRVWDVRTGALVRTLEKALFIGQFSSDGQTLIGCDLNQDAKLWNVVTGETTVIFQRGAAAPSAVPWWAFSRDGQRIAMTDESGTVRWWDATKRRLEILPEMARSGPVAFSPDARLLAIFDRKRNTIKICDLQTSKVIRALPLHSDSRRQYALAFSPDGRLLAHGDGDNRVRVWDYSADHEIAVFQGHRAPIIALDFTPDGKRLITTSTDSTVKMWRVPDTEEQNLLDGSYGDVDMSYIGFSPDNKMLATPGTNNTVKVWDLATKREIASFPGHTNPVIAAGFSPDAKFLVSSARDNTIRLWDRAKQLELWSTKSGWCPVFAWSPDGKVLATYTGDPQQGVKLWETPDRREIGGLQPLPAAPLSIAFSPDGKLLASSTGDGTTILWDVATRRKRATLKGHTDVGDVVVFSPDGKVVASSSDDGTVVVWAVETGTTIKTLSVSGDMCNAVAFSPDGRTLATGSGDNAVRLWETATWQNTLALRGHTEPVMAVAFSPDGLTLASSSMDGTVRLWSAPSLTQIDRERKDSAAH